MLDVSLQDSKMLTILQISYKQVGQIYWGSDFAQMCATVCI